MTFKHQTGSYLLALIILLGYLIILLMPVSPYIQERMMRKFHLSNQSSVEWAFWQLLPSMYNFANTAEVVEGELLVQMYRDKSPMRFNHYPVRVLTYFHHRPEQEQMTLDFLSVYQGNRLETRVHWIPEGDGQYRIWTESSRYTHH